MNAMQNSLMQKCEVVQSMGRTRKLMYAIAAAATVAITKMAIAFFKKN
jgi:hypothetical protein